MPSEKRASEFKTLTNSPPRITAPAPPPPESQISSPLPSAELAALAPHPQSPPSQITPTSDYEPAAKKVRRSRGGRVVGSQNFTDADKRRLFAIIRRIQPFGKNKWDIVGVEYNREAGFAARNTRTLVFLKRFYSAMLREELDRLNEDPLLPWAVREARIIKREIDEAVGKQDDSESCEEKDVDDGEGDEDHEFAPGVEDVHIGVPGSSSLLTPTPITAMRPASASENAILSKSHKPRAKMTISVDHATCHREDGFAKNHNGLLEKLVEAVSAPIEGSSSGPTADGVLGAALVRADARLDRMEAKNERLEAKNERLEREISELKDENRDLKLKLKLFESKLEATSSLGENAIGF